MELKYFISETLSQLVEGVIDAQSKVKDSGGLINPLANTPAPENILCGKDKQPLTVIKFNIALKAQKGTATKGGIGVITGLISAGSQGESNTDNISSHRIEFDIPLSLPKHKKNS